VRVVSHPYPPATAGGEKRRGARRAARSSPSWTPTDSTNPELIAQMLAKLDKGTNMVVGARNAGDHAACTASPRTPSKNGSRAGWWAAPVPDLTSGMRVARAEKFRRFLYRLPNGFSPYPTTITMSFFRSGLPGLLRPISRLQRAPAQPYPPVPRPGLASCHHFQDRHRSIAAELSCR